MSEGPRKYSSALDSSSRYLEQLVSRLVGLLNAAFQEVLELPVVKNS